MMEQAALVVEKWLAVAVEVVAVVVAMLVLDSLRQELVKLEHAMEEVVFVMIVALVAVVADGSFDSGLVVELHICPFAAIVVNVFAVDVAFAVDRTYFRPAWAVGFAEELDV